MAEVSSTRPEPAFDAEVERRVGRNLLLYQRIENALKRLLLISLSEGTPADIAQRAAERAARVMRLNLGEAAKAVFEQVLTNDPKGLPTRVDPSQTWSRIRITIGTPPDQPDSIGQLRDRCRMLVDQRNDLVHHCLRQWPRNGKEEAPAALAALDEQHVAASAFREEILGLMRALDGQRESFASYLNSDEGSAALEFAMAHGNILDVLVEVAESEARTDGWALLTTAQHRLLARAMMDVDLVKERLGRDWLLQVLEQASAIFEVAQEPLPNGPTGAFRRIYRSRATPGSPA